MHCRAPPPCWSCYWEVKFCCYAFQISCSTCHNRCSTAPHTHQPTEWLGLLPGLFPNQLPQPWCTSPFLVSISSPVNKQEACLSDPRASCRSNVDSQIWLVITVRSEPRRQTHTLAVAMRQPSSHTISIFSEDKAISEACFQSVYQQTCTGWLTALLSHLLLNISLMPTYLQYSG